MTYYLKTTRLFLINVLAVITPCTSSPCKNNGTCIRLSSKDYSCACNSDYADGGDCTECEYIDSTECINIYIDIVLSVLIYV